MEQWRAWTSSHRLRESTRGGSEGEVDAPSPGTAADDSFLSVPSLSTPSGGGAVRGLGQEFQVNAFTGTAGLVIPLPLPHTAQFEPPVNLAYGSGVGNDVFGAGFSAAIPFIARRTDRRAPLYTEDDEFFLAGRDLLTVAGREPEIRRDEDGREFQVRLYSPRAEREFDRIERWHEPAGGEVFWRVLTRENTEHVYGKTPEARVADAPAGDNARVFQWNLQESRDALGNRIVYEYKREDQANVPDTLNEKGRAHHRALHIKRIRFANHGTDESFAFELVFDYGEHDSAGDEPHREVRTWPCRADSFSSYRAGFELRVHRLVRNVMLFHRVEAEPLLNRRLRLTYDENPVLTRLTRAQLTGRRTEKGEYREKEAPPLEFEYSEFHPDQAGFADLDEPAARSALNRGEYRLLDLHGEGLPGILYADGESILYQSPRGDATYTAPRVLHRFPLDRELTESRYALADIDGDGRTELLVQSDERNGFYKLDTRDHWRMYRDFRSHPNPDPRADSVLVDVHGDGVPDMLVVNDDHIRVYRGLGETGFQGPRLLTRPRDFPAGNYDWRREAYRFGDMFGDGREHRVRVRSGSVECWPNLGHGKFGEKVELNNAPRFEKDFDARRVFLADVDGSGTLDLIYVQNDHALYCANQSGNSFADPVRIEIPETYDNFDQINFADVTGNGTACLVLSRVKAEVRHVYLDFALGVKPYLLTGIRDSMGGRTRIRYGSSVRHYLRDKKQGRPWATRLPFPVQLVEAVEKTDALTGTRFATKYSYHHGYFDPRYREFRGFGMVESRMAESFEQDFVGEIAFEPDPSELHATPILTRSWYHTGALEQREVSFAAYGEEFFQGDAQAPPPLTDQFEGEGTPGDPEELYWAYRALGGLPIREEVYGLDDIAGVSEHPYRVVESAYALASSRSASGGVFTVRPLESRNLEYERNPRDPRVTRRAILRVDQFNHPLLTANIAPARRAGPEVLPEQAVPAVMVESTEFFSETREFYRLGMLGSTRQYEVRGFAELNWERLSFEEIREHIEQALGNPIAYDREEPGRLHARLLSWTRRRYWKDDLSAVLEEGLPSARALPHREEWAVFPEEFVRDVWSGDAPGNIDELLEHDGHYERHDGYWFAPGPAVYYDAASRFRPVRTREADGGESEFAYDPFALVPVYSRDSLGNALRLEFDYQALQSKKITDANENISEFLFDPLGMVVASSRHGRERDAAKGDAPLDEYRLRPEAGMAEILAKPEYYLQGAGAFYFYDQAAFLERGEPVAALTLKNEIHRSDLGPDRPALVSTAIAYGDGTGRSLQTKMRVEAGPAFARNEDGSLRTEEDGKLLSEQSDERWLTSGRTVYNNAGLPVKQYEPFFGNVHAYEAESLTAEQGVAAIRHYDPMGREEKTELPGGFLNRVERFAWKQIEHDANDLVEESPHYLENRDNTAPEFADGLDALTKALAHAGTPETIHFDNQGRAVRIVRMDGNGTLAPEKRELDIRGLEYSIADTRLSAKGLVNFRRVFDMTGAVMRDAGGDNGIRLQLRDALGRVILNRDGVGRLMRSEYDSLGRRKLMAVREPGETREKVVQRIEYGETAGVSAVALNQRGLPVREFDSAGMKEIKLYDIHGRPRQIALRVTKDYREHPDWRTSDGTGFDVSNASMALDDQVWTRTLEYDVAGRVLREENGGAIFIHEYNQRGLPRSVRVTPSPDQSPRSMVRDVRYDAKNRRERVEYANGAVTRMEYESDTFRLSRMTTKRGNKSLQDIAYAYDPVGNITRIRDHSHKSVFGANTRVDPLLEYEYDALYRLMRADGRETSRPNGGANAWREGAPVNSDAVLSPYSRRFEYDDAGNLLSMRHRAADSSLSFTRRFAADESSNKAVPETRLKGAAPGGFFDGNGALMSLEHTGPLTWNYQEQIARVEILSRADGPGDSEFYLYDGERNRVRKVVERYQEGGRVLAISDVLYFGSLEIHREYRIVNGVAQPVRRERRDVHVMDGEKRIAIIQHWTKSPGGSEPGAGESRVRYQAGNHLQSAALELDEAGRVISYEEFFPYGGTAFIAGDNHVEVKRKLYRYAGKERDGTGLYYYGARYFAPWLGRWMCADPAGVEDGLNLFAFTRGNPVTNTDPDGTHTWATLAQWHTEFERISGGYRDLVRVVRQREGALPSIEVDTTGAMGSGHARYNHETHQITISAADYRADNGGEVTEVGWSVIVFETTNAFHRAALWSVRESVATGRNPITREEYSRQIEAIEYAGTIIHHEIMREAAGANPTAVHLARYSSGTEHLWRRDFRAYERAQKASGHTATYDSQYTGLVGSGPTGYAARYGVTDEQARRIALKNRAIEAETRSRMRASSEARARPGFRIRAPSDDDDSDSDGGRSPRRRAASDPGSANLLFFAAAFFVLVVAFWLLRGNQ